MNSLQSYPILYDHVASPRAHSAGNTDSCCCSNLINRVSESVVSFFTVIALALWAVTTWFLDTFCGCDLDDGHNPMAADSATYDISNPAHNPYAAHNAAKARTVNKVPAQGNQGPGSIFNQQFPLDAQGFPIIPVEYWDAAQIEGLQPGAATGLSVPAEFSATEQQKVENLAEHRQNSLDRLKTIQESITSGNLLKFKIIEEIMHFDLDEELSPYSKNTPVTKLLEMLDYAGECPEYQKLSFFKKQQQADLSLYERKKTLKGHLDTYDPKLKNGEQTKIASESLSQIFNIWDAKKRKIEQEKFNTPELKIKAENELKAEIRIRCGAISDAHINCVDNVNGAVQGVLLDIFECELKASKEKTKPVILASFTLFKYRANLIREITLRLFPHEPHMADLERMAVEKIGPLVGLNGQAVLVGAQFVNLVPNSKSQIKRITNEFLSRYNSKDGVPIAFLLRELMTVAGANNTRELRTAMIQHVSDKLAIHDLSIEDDYVFSDWQAKEISKMATSLSEDVEASETTLIANSEQDVFQLFTNLSDAGIVWLMEEAGLIKEIPSQL